MIRLAIAFFALLLVGCVAVQPISDAERRKVSSVVINEQLSKVPTIYYLGGMGGLMFGAVGAAAGAQSMEDSRKSFQAFVEKSGISIDRIVLEEMTAAIQRSGKFPLAARPEPGGAAIDIFIAQYGFSIPHGFSSKLVPIVSIRCEMKDAAGKVIWSARDFTTTLGNPVEAVEPEAIRNDPKVMEAAWRAAAKHLAAAIVSGY